MSYEHLNVMEVIRPDTVDLDLKGITCKEEAINYLAGLLNEAGLIDDKDAYIQSVYERESLGPTYMENFIAIPHGKCAAVREAGIAFGRSPEGFEYLTQDGGGLAKLVFLLAIPERTAPDAYIAVLAQLARLLVHDEFRAKLMEAKCYQDVFEAIAEGQVLLED